MKNNKTFKVLAPTAILGYGFPDDAFRAGMDMQPDLVAVDGGSVDPGPYYLGSGKSFTDKASVKRDLRRILVSAIPKHVPVVVGTAGGSGSRSHLEWCRDIVTEIAEENSLCFKLGIIYADIEPAIVSEALARGNISSVGGAPPLAQSDVDNSSNIVAQMGIEPIIKAHETGCDVIIAGRAYDPAPFAALPVSQGYPIGPALHMGKILECAAIAADPGSGADPVLGILDMEGFTLVPLSSNRNFTPESVAAHSLYEKSDPYTLPGPGGALLLDKAGFSNSGSGKVRVTGSRFEKSENYTVKLEGAAVTGYRTACVAGVRDPVMIDAIDSILDAVNSHIVSVAQAESLEGTVHFHVYGKDAVMGKLEPVKKTTSHELGIVMEAVGKDQDTADALCGIARSKLLHYGYPGRISTAGNLAFPFSPSDISIGAVYEFSIYHIMTIPDQNLFPLKTMNL